MADPTVATVREHIAATIARANAVREAALAESKRIADERAQQAQTQATPRE